MFRPLQPSQRFSPLIFLTKVSRATHNIIGHLFDNWRRLSRKQSGSLNGVWAFPVPPLNFRHKSVPAKLREKRYVFGGLKRNWNRPMLATLKCARSTVAHELCGNEDKTMQIYFCRVISAWIAQVLSCRSNRVNIVRCLPFLRIWVMHCFFIANVARQARSW
jgi:hypothetical protein